jgi:hypothetical protein
MRRANLAVKEEEENNSGSDSNQDQNQKFYQANPLD